MLPDEPLAGCRVLVTGAGGFIGHHLAARLASIPGVEVRALVRRPPGPDLEAANVRLFTGDLGDPASLARAALDVDFVFHLAGLTRAKSRAVFERVNADGAVAMLAACRSAAPKLRRFVHMSSLAAVGPCRDGAAVDEQTPPRPVTEYGASKLSSELKLRHAAGDLPWTIVRPPAVYGPRERDIFTVFRMVDRRIAPILGLTPKTYSIVHAGDLVEATLRLAVEPRAQGETYFVAAPATCTNVEMVEAMERALGCRAFKFRVPHAAAAVLGAANSCLAPFLAVPPLLTLGRLRELVPTRWVCSSEKLWRDTGYACPTELEAGIGATVEWYRDAGWLPRRASRRTAGS